MYDVFACAMLEFSSIGAGIESADRMVKAAAVEPVVFKTMCPGKYLAAVKGDVAAVDAAAQAGLQCGGTRVVDWFTLANIHADVFPALCGAGVSPAILLAARSDRLNALGIIETYSASAAVLAADRAVKAAAVDLLDIRMAMGLGGKGCLLLTGDVAAVEAAVDAGSAEAGESGLLVSGVVIPRPSRAVWEQIL